MRVHKNEHVTPFDVDHTLILPFDNTKEHQVGRVVQVHDPVTNKLIKMVAHEPMIRLLREEHQRGSHVVVWSRGGYEWATAVIDALNLRIYVHDVFSKPLVYFDDVEITEWLKYRVYLTPETQYKR